MSAESVPQNDCLARKIVSTNIGDVRLCAKVCLRICVSVEVDGPGPFNPSITVCVEVMVEV